MNDIINNLFNSESMFTMLFSWLPDGIISLIVSAILIVFVVFGINIILKIIDAFT